MLSVSGHTPQQDLLRTLRSHTLLFSGPEGVGRRRVAQWYASFLNCQQRDAVAQPCGECSSCRLFTTGSHPDYFEVAPQLLTTSGRLSRRPEIRIAQLVARVGEDEPLSRWLESPPTFNKRVGVIDRADTLNRSAANAFLKFLEEPPSHAVIILIAPSPQAVLATIASRSTTVRFGTVLPESANSEAAHPLARLGRMGDRVRQSENQAAADNLQEAIRDYFQALPKGLELAFEAADVLEKLWTNETTFDVSEHVLAYASQYLPEHYYAVAEAVQNFEEALAAYASASLAVQVMTLNLRRGMT